MKFKFMIFMILIFSLLFVVLTTAKISLDTNLGYESYGQIQGELDIILNTGELIPADSEVRVNLGEQEKTFKLSELVSVESIEGDFYIEDFDISGFGSGYGGYGEREIYPEIRFIIDLNESIEEEEEEEEDPVVIDGEEVEDSDEKICSESIECEEFGDCINDYQTKICIITNENCEESETSEQQECVSDFELPSSAKESHDKIKDETEEVISEEEIVEEEEVSEEIIDEEEVIKKEPEIEEQCSEECFEVCEEGEEICTEECTEEESCSESCSTDDEGNEECEEICETEEICEEICETGDEICEEICEEVCEIPEELFDITFDLEESSLVGSDKLIVWVTLQNFGKKYVPARLIYIVTDEFGVEVYKNIEEVRVYTDEAIITKFEDLILSEGDYNLKMEIEYAGIAGFCHDMANFYDRTLHHYWGGLFFHQIFAHR